MIWEGINIELKATNIDLTDQIYDYVVKKITNLGTLLLTHPGEVRVYFDVGKTTKHHRLGAKIFRADCKIWMAGLSEFYSSSEQEDLYKAIDDVKDKLFSEIRKSKTKKEALWRRGARRLKGMLKGIIK